MGETVLLQTAATAAVVFRRQRQAVREKTHRRNKKNDQHIENNVLRQQQNEGICQSKFGRSAGGEFWGVKWTTTRRTANISLVGRGGGGIASLVI